MYASDRWSSGEVYRVLSVLFRESRNDESILDSLPVGIAVLDLDGHIGRTNRLHLQQFGTEEIRITPSLLRIAADVIANNRAKSNVPITAAITAMVCPHGDQTVILVTEPQSSSARDVQLELLQAVDTPAYLASDANGIVGANAAFLALTQFRLEDLIGKRPTEIHGDDFFPWHFSDMLKETTLKTRTGVTLPITVKVRTLGGGRIRTSMVCVPACASPVGSAPSDTMVALERVSGKIAHELNNALTVVLAGTDSLRAQFGSVKAIQTDLDYISQASRRTIGIVQDLLTFSQRRPEAREVIIPDQAIHNMEPLLRATVGDKELEIRTDATSSRVRIASNALETALTKLTQNAAEAVDEVAGLIRIETSRITPDHLLHQDLLRDHRLANIPHVRIRVIDNGRGIAPEHQKYLFEPFFTTAGGRAGLGMSVVYGIVKRAGGLIFVESTLGLGSTITIWIPEVSDCSH